MGYGYKICQQLSHEHQIVIALLGRFRDFLRAHSITQQPDWTLHGYTNLLSDLKCALESEVTCHFAIEEKEIFPAMEAEGYSDLMELLIEDHKVILDLVAQIKPILARAMAASAPLSGGDWETLYRQGNALVTELSGHAEKEEAGLVPAMEETLDEALADEIYRRYQRAGSVA